MANKVDLRVLKTKEAVKNAFKCMFLEKPYEKLTIKELCERAVINRKTFYLHYSCIEDVLDEFQEEQTFEYYERIKDFDHIKEIDKLIKVFFEYTEEQGKFYELLHCNNRYDYLRNRQTNKVSIKSQNNFKSIRKFDECKQNIILNFIGSSLLGIYRQWISDGKRMSIDEVIKISTVLIKSGIDEILK
ncbi:TetR/AcrR family transcriptional regulator C-terminal domain-containing protein [Parvimonas micra]|uniref:TetR/AcrR family transcriptional regulator n=1 Tax=Parvimonas micra TaxID=33033 RepID=UPI0028DD2459|nr:TetR/AcrR family transcriptional regulator C-terminal domain-containing protein [Parvimonas micra]